ncbi:Sec23-binding domain of Sec16-domain-containing protein [Cytidiella melzeri]|nr:Sec23-binding domain of Sec16-domain-containing protein [Cytidiella melzeri]
MTTAGEAASLFGAVDLANDPFALTAPEEPEVLGNDPFANIQPTTEAADVFGYSASHDTAPAAPQEYATSYGTTEGHNASWNGSNALYQAPSSSHDSYSHTQQDAYSAHTATNGWNGISAQWAGHDSQQQYRPVNGAYGNHSYAPKTQPNDTYASYNNSAYTPSAAPPAPAVATSSRETYAHSANSYSAYMPAVTSHATSYEPSYDPYKPAQVSPPTHHVAQAAPTYAQFVNEPHPIGPVPPVPHIEAPPRNKVSAAPYRPKTTNAYDPPLPPPKVAPKRPAAWQSPISSAQLANSATLGSPPICSSHTPSLPPPPRKASVPPPPPRTGSAARQHTNSPVPLPVTNAHTVYGVSPLLRSPPSSGYHPSPATSAHEPPPPASPYPPPPAPLSTYQPSPPSLQAAASRGDTDPVPQDCYSHNTDPEATQLANNATDSVESHALESYWENSHQRSAAEEGVGSSMLSMHNDNHDPEADMQRAEHNIRQDDPAAHSSSEVDHGRGPTSTSFEVAESDKYDPEGGQREIEPFVDERNRSTDAYSPEPLQPSSVYQADSVYDPYRPTAAASHAEPSHTRAASNVYSPELSASLSWTSSQRQSLDESRPGAVTSPSIAPPPRGSSIDRYSAPAYSYEPATAAVQRTASPSSVSVRSGKSSHSIRDPYASPEHAAPAAAARYRSMSNGSAYSLGGSLEDRYAPSHHSSQDSTEIYSHTASAFVGERSLASPSHTQTVTLTTTTHAQYAPSPSLLGSNDPLGRTSVRVPVFTFGFGGKVVTCFHGSDMLHTGFDVAMSSRASTSLHIRPLHAIISQSAIESSAAVYPGPLFSDPGAPTTVLVRTGAAASAKAKKAKVVKYLKERAEEISQGLGYMPQGSVEVYRAEAKRTLISMLRVLVENDGQLSGSPEVDIAVRAVLVTNGEPSPDPSADVKLMAPATAGVRTAFELTSSYHGGLSSMAQDSKNVKLADHPLWSSQLDKIEGLLVRGDRRGAYQYAADEKLWAHAMVIASSIDKESWKEVVTEFVRSELSGASIGAALSGAPGKSTLDRGREPLRVAYSLFAGQGASCVQELHPPKTWGMLTHPLSAVPLGFPTATPLSAVFPQTIQPVVLPQDTLMKWPTTVAMVLGSSSTPESSATLTALGDHLAMNNWVEAAHVCYLLSPQTSHVGGIGFPGARVVLYGSPSPQVAPAVCKDPDAVIFSEIVEYALSLKTPAKGQEAFSGLSYLQPYRLLRAICLAELGHMDLANRYCEAISNSISRGSPYLNVTFMEQLKDFADRLVAAPLVDRSGSWIGSKMTRPSLDKIGNWLEGRLTSFIAGEGDSPNTADTHAKTPSFSGPFARYSTISSLTNSTMPSPQMSYSELTESQNAAPPFRSGSAMALRTSTASPAQIARASSAIDYLRRKPSPVPRTPSAGVPILTTLPPRAQAPYGYTNGFPDPATQRLASPSAQEDSSDRPSGPQVASWWGTGDSESATPTATSFPPANESTHSSSEGFITLMDAPGVSAPSSSTTAQFTAAAQIQSIGREELYEDDDLGLGNTANRAKDKVDTPAEAEKGAASPAAEKPKEPEKPVTPGGGWLSRLWKRGESGPIKASLGEENTFYYDAEQKRWINKKAPPEAAITAPPPPPPRAQTASPGMSAARGPPASSPGPSPPVRPATAIDLTDGPPKKPPMRIRSNLVPPESASVPVTPGSAVPPRTPNTMMDGPPGLDAPPTPGARRPQPKRNARSRYVDVFQQESST